MPPHDVVIWVFQTGLIFFILYMRSQHRTCWFCFTLSALILCHWFVDVNHASNWGMMKSVVGSPEIFKNTLKAQLMHNAQHKQCTLPGLPASLDLLDFQCFDVTVSCFNISYEIIIVPHFLNKPAPLKRVALNKSQCKLTWYQNVISEIVCCLLSYYILW